MLNSHTEIFRKVMVLRMKFKPLCIGDLCASVPVIQGGMGIGVSLSKLAGTVAREGGIGIISTAQIGYRYEGFDCKPIETNMIAIVDEIKKAREIAQGGILGVNIMVATQKYELYVKEAVKAGIDLIISGAGLPMKLPELIGDSKVKIAPIVSSLKAAEVICKYWVRKYKRTPDMLVVEGPKAGGHLGFTREEVNNLTEEAFAKEVKAIVEYVEELSHQEKKEIPVVLAGGIYDANDAFEAMKLGIKGVQMATRFVTTHECDAPQSYKNMYLKAKKEDIIIISSPVGMPGRAIKNNFLNRLMKEGKIPHRKCHRCVSTCKPAEIPYCITDALVNAVTDHVEDALLFCGSNAYKAETIESVKDIMNEFKVN